MSYSFGPENSWKLTPFLLWTLSCLPLLTLQVRDDSFSGSSFAFFSVSEHLTAFLVCLYSSLFAPSGSPLE